MIKYEIDENNFLTGNFAIVGKFDNQIELEELIEPDINLQWNGTELVKGINPKSVEKDLEYLRQRREEECFSVINRGVLWYSTLTAEQTQELNEWYKEWLDITNEYRTGIDIETIIPKKPKWLK